jgi:hypothetical protein
MWNIVVGTGIHGFAHWQITTLWGSRPQASSWLLSSSAGLGDALWVMALLTFLAAGIGAAFHLGWWRPMAVLGAAVSLVVMVLYWDSRLWMGAAVDIGVLAGLLWLGWPSTELMGA